MSFSGIQSQNMFFFLLFFRIRKGFPFEARVVARILPQFLDDFFPPQDVMNKVIGEFLSNQQPYPQFMATVVYKVVFIYFFFFFYLNVSEDFYITESSIVAVNTDFVIAKKPVAVVELWPPANMEG